MELTFILVRFSQDVLYTICNNCGPVQRIVIFRKNGVQAMVEYPFLNGLTHCVELKCYPWGLNLTLHWKKTHNWCRSLRVALTAAEVFVSLNVGSTHTGPCSYRQKISSFEGNLSSLTLSSRLTRCKALSEPRRRSTGPISTQAAALWRSSTQRYDGRTRRASLQNVLM